MADVLNTIISAVSDVFANIFGGLEDVVSASSSFLGDLS